MGAFCKLDCLKYLQYKNGIMEGEDVTIPVLEEGKVPVFYRYSDVKSKVLSGEIGLDYQIGVRYKKRGVNKSVMILLCENGDFDIFRQLHADGRLTAEDILKYGILSRLAYVGERDTFFWMAHLCEQQYGAGFLAHAGHCDALNKQSLTRRACDIPSYVVGKYIMDDLTTSKAEIFGDLFLACLYYGVGVTEFDGHLSAHHLFLAYFPKDQMIKKRYNHWVSIFNYLVPGPPSASILMQNGLIGVEKIFREIYSKREELVWHRDPGYPVFSIKHMKRKIFGERSIYLKKNEDFFDFPT